VTAPLRDRITLARDAFVRAGIPPDEASLDAEVLARHVLEWDRAQLLTNWHSPPPEAFESAFASLVGRREAREPVAFIVGHREFWGLEFYVSPAALIPRPETELVIEQVLVRHASNRPLRVVDVGTGSGCIAVALARELPAAHVLAIDISAAALAVAARNVVRHALAGRVQLLRGNLLDAVTGPVDLIASNPPYVARADAPALQPEVARFEPEEALFAGEHGLAVLRVLCDTAAPKLAPGGFLIVEFGAGQHPALRAMAESKGWTVEIAADLAGIPRVAVLSRPAEWRLE
jgi:release factor glutamine methyltransferase